MNNECFGRYLKWWRFLNQENFRTKFLFKNPTAFSQNPLKYNWWNHNEKPRNDTEKCLDLPLDNRLYNYYKIKSCFKDKMADLDNGEKPWSKPSWCIYGKFQSEQLSCQNFSTRLTWTIRAFSWNFLGTFHCTGTESDTPMK